VTPNWPINERIVVVLAMRATVYTVSRSFWEAPQLSEAQRGVAYACAAALLWGTWPLYAHAGGVTGPSLAFLTLLTMALPAPFVFRRAFLRDRLATAALVVVGLADAANAALYFSALARGPVLVATLTHALAPLLVALFGPMISGERRSPRAVIAAPIVLVGLTLVLLRSSHDGAWQRTAVLGTGSALFYAMLVIASRVAGRTYPPLAVASLHSVVSVLALSVMFGARALPELNSRLPVTLLGCLGNGLVAAVLFNLALVRLGGPRTGVLTALEPLTASLLGVLIFGEAAGVETLAGTIIILVALGWTARERSAVTLAGVA
jgi:drug/metabolite transporter (DMT)-like permease